MNTGQMLLVVGAIMLLSFMTLTVNTLFLSKTTTILQAEAQFAAISIAQSMIDEFMTQSFDSATVNGTKVFDSTKFTPIIRLGPETTPGINEVATVSLPEPPDTIVGYKSLTKYNDADDYNNYRRYYYSRSLGTFAVIDSVFYVQELNVDSKSTAPTFCKKILVTVRHPNLCPPGVNYNPWQGNYGVQVSDIMVYRRYF